MVPSSENHPNWIIGGFTVILHTLFSMESIKKPQIRMPYQPIRMECHIWGLNTVHLKI